MFERLTDRAQKAMALANQESQRFNHEYVGTEHLLLGLIKEGSGVGANIMRKLGIDLREVRRAVESRIKKGPDPCTTGKLPQTPRAKKVIEYAIEESRCLNHNYIGTEHLFLGLLREGDGVAAQVLHSFGVTIDAVRLQLDEMLYQPHDTKGEDESETEPMLIPKRLSIALAPTNPNFARLTNERGIVVSGAMPVQLAREIVKRYNASQATQ